MASSSGGSESRMKYPRMCSSRPSYSEVSSTPDISSMPHHAASGRATCRADTVSWSVMASAPSPTRAAATTTSQGEQAPSEWVVWTCRSAAPEMADVGKTYLRRRH